MYFSLSVPTSILCCILYCSLTTCAPVEPISEEKLNQGLLELDEKAYQGFLLYSIPAASSGKNFFRMSQSVSDDCVRIARVITQSFFEPSNHQAALYTIMRAVNETSQLKTGSTWHSQVDRLCRTIDELVDNALFTQSAYEAAKKAVTIPRPSKNYIVEIPSSQTVKEWSSSVSFLFDDLEMLKFQVILAVLKFRNKATIDKSKPELAELIVISKTIGEMARKSFKKAEIDKIFTEAYEDFIKNLPRQGGVQVEGDQVHASVFLKTADRYFLNNDSLKEEYSKMKKEISS